MLSKFQWRPWNVTCGCVQACDEDLDALFHARAAVVLGDAVADELERPVAAADTHDQTPAAAQDVQGGCFLGQADGVVERDHVHGSANADPSGTGSHGSCQNRRRRRQPVVRKVVLGQPHRVEAQLFRQDHLVHFLSHHLRRRAARRSLQKKVRAEAHNGLLRVPASSRMLTSFSWQSSPAGCSRVFLWQSSPAGDSPGLRALDPALYRARGTVLSARLRWGWERRVFLWQSHLRATPQGYAPWTRLVQGPWHSTLCPHPLG